MLMGTKLYLTSYVMSPASETKLVTGKCKVVSELYLQMYQIP